MAREQIERAREMLRRRGISRALFSDPFTVTWLTGYAPLIQLGPEPTSGGPALAWLEDGQVTLLVQDSEAGTAGQTGLPVETYPGKRLTEPLREPANLAKALARLLHSSAAGQSIGTVGIEASSLPLALAQVLSDSLSGEQRSEPVDGWLEPARREKTSAELDLIRAAIRLSETGHVAARQLTPSLVGMREIDVWAAVRTAVERDAGQRVALGNNCVVSRRSPDGGGFPSEEQIRMGDSLLLDLAARWEGYWSASTVTHFAGTPDEEQQRLHRVVSEALQIAIELVRPGVPARQIDEAVRRHITLAGLPDFPHHTGHGIGVSQHEEPRIIPSNDLTLTAGMVIALEPAVYLPGQTGVRLEDVVLVTSTGAELLTHHDKSI